MKAEQTQKTNQRQEAAGQAAGPGASSSDGSQSCCHTDTLYPGLMMASMMVVPEYPDILGTLYLF